jgi:hypothetical protein
VVHTLLHLDQRAERLFPTLTQQAASKVFARLGWNYCGVPRLGPHSLRTYHCCEAINNPDIAPADYPALAWVSVDTMNTVYAAPTLRGPAAQLAFKSHAEAAGESHDSQAVADTEQQQRKKEKLEPEKQQVQLSEQKQILNQMQELMFRQQQQHEQQLQQQQQQQQYTMQQQMLQQSMMQRHTYGMAPVDVLQDRPLQPAVLAVATAVEPAPYGRALSTLRHKHDAAIICFFKSQGPISAAKLLLLPV